jgi:hypothetical protein
MGSQKFFVTFPAGNDLCAAARKTATLKFFPTLVTGSGIVQ